MNRLHKNRKSENGRSSSRELKEEIERTGSRINETVNEIASRIHLPWSFTQEIKSYLAHKVEHFDAGEMKRLAVRTTEKAGKSVQENPVPVILGCITVAAIFLPDRWKFWKGEDLVEPIAETGSTIGKKVRHSLDRCEEAVSDAAHTARNKVSHLTSHAKEKVEDLSERATDTLSSVAGKTTGMARESTAKVRSVLREGTDQFPVGMAVGALTLGFLAALAIPRTRRVDHAMSESSNSVQKHVKDWGRDFATEAKEKLREKDLDGEGLQKRVLIAFDSAVESARKGIREYLDS